MSKPSDESRSGGRQTVLTVVLVLIVLLPFGYSLVSGVFAGPGEPEEPFLERPAPEHENCIRDTEYMRYHHWELLRAEREKVVRYGIRGSDGLKNCMDCHTSRENFCEKCHIAASVWADCWGCHYYP